MVAGLPYTRIVGTTSVEGKTCHYSFTTWYPLFPGVHFISIPVLSWLLFDDNATCKYIGNSLWPDYTATRKDSIFIQAFVNSLKPGLKKAMLNNKPRILERARIEAATLEDVNHRMVADKKSGCL